MSRVNIRTRRRRKNTAPLLCVIFMNITGGVMMGNGSLPSYTYELTTRLGLSLKISGVTHGVCVCVCDSAEIREKAVEPQMLLCHNTQKACLLEG